MPAVLTDVGRKNPSPRRSADDQATPPSCPALDGLGLAGRRFPFRPETPAEATALLADIDAVLRWAQPRIEFIARSRARQQSLGPSDAEDMAANALAELWRRLPKYDARRGPLTNYIYLVTDSRLKDQANAIHRQRRREIAMNGAIDFFHAPERATDREVFALADRIEAQPRDWFDSGDVRVLHALLGDRRRTTIEAAELLGCSRQSVSRSIARMLARLREIAQEELLP